jgi:hypothetical protein
MAKGVGKAKFLSSGRSESRLKHRLETAETYPSFRWMGDWRQLFLAS